MAVYRNRSFTKAAEQLYTSQPTISEHIRNLENRLDCRLFDRLGRSIIPTFEADLLYPRALAILDDLKKLKEDLSAAGKTVAGEIVVAASTIPSAFILPRLAAEFAARHPKISFEIRTADSAEVVRAVEDNEVLLGVVGARNDSDKLDFQRFLEDELVLAAASKRVLNPRITLGTLQELPFILREKGSGTRKSMERFLEEKDITTADLNCCAVLGSSTAVAEAVKSDLGVSILSRHAIREGLEHGSIQTVDILNLEMKRYFYTVKALKRSLPHPYQAFLGFLQSAAAEEKAGRQEGGDSP